MNKLYQEWNNLSAKIKSLLLVYRNLQPELSNSAFGGLKPLGEHVKKCFNYLIKFKDNFEKTLSTDALVCLRTFIDDNRPCFDSNDNYKQLNDQLIVSNIGKLGLLESELSYLLSDTQTRICKTVEVAFAHLQRQIVADESIRKTWANAWKKGETHCEKLGGAHLLSHKIWAFKAHSEGERTDLVLQESINLYDPLYQSVDGLVLTEWKKVKNQGELHTKIEEAKKQASRYKLGSLFPLELSNFCYLIMLSNKNLEFEKQPDSSGEVTFQVINIACNPNTPSKDSKSTKMD